MSPLFPSRLVRLLVVASALLHGLAPALVRAETAPPVIWDASVNLAVHEPMRRYFRVVIDLPEKPVVSARLRFGGQNQGEIHVNGAFVGAWQGWGDMPRQDFAPLLRPGRNILAVSVERGTSRLHTLKNLGRAGNQYALLGRLRVEFADGKLLTVETDGSWQASPVLPADWPLAKLDEGWGPVAVYTINDLWDYVFFRGSDEYLKRFFTLEREPTRWDLEQRPRPLGPIAVEGRPHVAGIGSGHQYLVDERGRSLYWLGLGTQVSIGRSAAVSPTYEFQHRVAEDWYAYLGSWGLNGSLLFVGEPWNDATVGYLKPFLHRWDRMGYSVMALPIMNRTIFVEGQGPALGKRYLKTSYDSDYFFPDSAAREHLNRRYDDVIATVAEHPSVFSLSLHDEAFYWPKAGSQVQEAAWRRFVEQRHGDLAAAARHWGTPAIQDWSRFGLAEAMKAAEGSRLNLDLGLFRDEVVVNHLDVAAKRLKARAPRLLLTKNFNNWTNWIAKKSATRTPELDLVSLNNFTHRLYEFAGQIRFTRMADRPFLAPSIRADNIASTWTAFLMGAAGSAPFYDGRWFLYATREEIEQMRHVREFVDEIDLSGFRRLRPAVAVLYAPEVPMNTNASDFSNPMLEQPSAKRYVRVMRALDRAGIDHDHILTEAEAANYSAVLRLEPGVDADTAAASLVGHSALEVPAGLEARPFAFRLLREDRRLGFFLVGNPTVLDDGRTQIMPPGARAGLTDSRASVKLTGLAPSTAMRVTLLHPLTGERRTQAATTDSSGRISLPLPTPALDGFVVIRAVAE